MTAENELVEGVEQLPEDSDRKQVVAQITHFRRGPIPAPEELEAYKRIDPSVLDYIISDARANAEHQRYCEKAEVECNATYNLRGQRYAFAATCGSLVICALAIVFLDGFSGNVIALVFGATGVTPIVTSFISSMKNIMKQK